MSSLALRHVALMVAVLGTLASASAARAALPGLNGKIAFTSNLTGHMEVYSANPDGTGRSPLTSGEHDSEFYASWSPDGTKIAFTSSRDQTSLEIYVMN